MSELFDDIEIDENETDQAKVHQDLMGKLRKTQKQMQANVLTTGNKSSEPGGDNEGYTVICLPKCKGVHLFHKECIHQQFLHKTGDFITCAVCETIYGIRVGSMPDGQMTWRLVNSACQGYEGS